MGEALQLANFVLTLVFALEMVLKLYAMRFRGYWRDSFNRFDMVIVIVSLIEIVVSPPTALTSSAGGKGSSVTTALRTFRLFRIFKLARNWISLRVLLVILINSLKTVANFSIILTLFVFIGAVVGEQLFANRLHFDGYTSKW